MEDFLNSAGFVFGDDEDRTKGIIEAVLFAVGNPVSIRELGELLELNDKQIKRHLSEMSEEYDRDSRGLYLVEFNNKVQISTKPEYGDYIKRFVKPDSRQNLSQAALETLAIVAYKQPITKAEIDEIRGVRSERAIATLLERGLIVESGRLDTTGRPIIYSTTEDFLKYFGFKSISELPELIEFKMDFVEE
jgi:segregation and condensation protein B